MGAGAGVAPLRHPGHRGGEGALPPPQPLPSIPLWVSVTQGGSGFCQILEAQAT